MSIAIEAFEELQNALTATEQANELVKKTLLKRISDHRDFHAGYTSLTLEKDGEILQEIIDEFETIYEIFEDTLCNAIIKAEEVVEELEDANVKVENIREDVENARADAQDVDRYTSALSEISDCLSMDKDDKEILGFVSDTIAEYGF